MISEKNFLNKYNSKEKRQPKCMLAQKKNNRTVLLR